MYLSLNYNIINVFDNFINDIRYQGKAEHARLRRGDWLAGYLWLHIVVLGTHTAKREPQLIFPLLDLAWSDPAYLSHGADDPSQ